MKYKNVSVLGLGKTGVAVANLLSDHGVRVFVSDNSPEEKLKKYIPLLKNGIEYETGGHTTRVLSAGLIVKSPGVPNDISVIADARAKGIDVLDELEISYGLIKPKVLVAITGTNGKTTTTALVGEILKNAGMRTVVGGNIGNPLSGLVDKIDGSTAVVLEVSSYQLEGIRGFRPDVCAILNITPDHLERHKSMSGYIEAKKRIYMNQTGDDVCILNMDDESIRDLFLKKEINPVSKTLFFMKEMQEAAIPGGGVFYGASWRDGRFEVTLPPLSGNREAVVNARMSVNARLKIPGRHNIENALAAVCISAVCGVPAEVIRKTLNDFPGVEHRIQFVREIKGVKYINDSKSTNVDSTRTALDSFDTPVILIMGGRDKGFPYTPLFDRVRKNVKALLLIGESAEKIKKELGGSAQIVDCGDLAAAVRKASEIAVAPDVVLLSPGCSSFDQFENYEDRGGQFIRQVNSL